MILMIGIDHPIYREVANWRTEIFNKIFLFKLFKYLTEFFIYTFQLRTGDNRW